MKTMLLFIIAYSIHPLAWGNNCRISLGVEGDKVLLLDGEVVQSYDTLDELANAFAKLKKSGLCSSSPVRKCGVSANDKGMSILTVNDKEIEYYLDTASKPALTQVVETLDLLKNVGVCPKKSGLHCRVGKGEAGYNTVVIDDNIVERGHTLATAIETIKWFRKKRVCQGKRR